nr:adhesion G protein-coupled receptor L4-like [Crassostrea gigas]
MGKREVIRIYIFGLTDAKRACFQGWNFYKDRCFKAFREARPWEESRDQCRLFPHGDLASFTSADDQHAVQSEVIRDTSESYWIGLHSNGSSWIWTTGEDITAFSSFPDGAQQQIGSGNNTYHLCVELRNNLWTGISCDVGCFYICQSTTINCQHDLGWMTTVSKHCIKAMTSLSGWYEGRDICRSHGADLARFHTKTELDYLQQNSSVSKNLYWVDLGLSGSNCRGLNVTQNHVVPFLASCNVQHVLMCEISSCASREGEYGCNSLFCISRTLLCDGHPDCPNGSDETPSLCDKYTTSAYAPETVTQEAIFDFTSSFGNSTCLAPMDETKHAILQCQRVVVGVARKQCYRDIAGLLDGRLGIVEEVVGALHPQERVKGYLDIYDTLLSIEAGSDHFVNVNHIMNISTVLENEERYLSSRRFYDDVYVEERENIVLRIERNVWKTESNSSLVGDYSMQFLNDHMGKPRVDGHFHIPSLPQANVTIVMLLIDRHMKGHRTTGNTSDGVIRISPVLSLSAFKGEVSLSLEHSFTLRHYPSVVETINGNDGTKERGIECGYLDQQTRLWAYDGCFVLHTSPLNTTCFCNHTTNFAILMQVKEFEISSSHSMALNIVTYIGCTVSLITQLLAISVFSCLPSLNSERTCVHRNLCFAITAAQLLFLTGIKAVQIKFICSVVALLLHYFYSAVFVWMLVEGLLLYSKVVQVFGSEKSRIAYYYAFGWGVPLIIVVISATSNWSGYGTENSCWLSMANGAVWAFVGPAVSVIIVNMVILWLVVRIVINLERCDEYRQIRSGVKSAIFLLPLLGLTWIFGLLAVNKDTVIFQYIFAFLNSLQGFFIFLFHCVCNSEVRQAVKRMRERRVLSKQEFFNASETQNQSGGACSLKNDQMLGKPNGDDLRKVYPPLHMTSSTCISSNGNALLDNLKLEDVTRENDLVFI